MPSPPSADVITMNNLAQTPPTIAITTTTGQDTNLEPPCDVFRSNSSESQEQHPSSPSAASTNVSCASTPTTPIEAESTDASPRLQPRSCNDHMSRSDTLVASEAGASQTSSVSTPEDSTLHDSILQETPRSWSRPLFAPWSSMWLANIIAVCVCAITIMTLIYSHRGDVSQRWNNLAAFFQWCQADNYSKPICRKVKNESLSMPPYASMEVIYERLVRRFTPASDLGSEDQLAGSTEHPFAMIHAMWIALITLLVACACGAFLWYIRHRNAVKRTLVRSTNHIARSSPTGTYSTGSTVDDQRRSELRRRMRAFVPAEDALKHLKTNAGSSQTSVTESINSDTKIRRDSDSSYRRGSWVHHEAPPYNNNDWFFFSSGTASSDPWDLKHRRQHLDKASTHNWWHSADLKLAQAHDKEEQEHTLHSTLETVTRSSSSTTGSDAVLFGARNRHRRESQNADHLGEDEKEGKEHFYSSWLRPDPVMFGPVNIKPGKLDSALAYMGCVLASSVGGSAMQKVPMEVPLDESKLSWMPMSPQDTVPG